MAQTQYGDISQRTAVHAMKRTLEHARPIEVLTRFGTVRPLPKNTANNAKFRRPVPFTEVSGSPLTEGVTPTAVQMAYEDVPVAMVQYGNLVEITDHVEDMIEDPVLNDATELMGENAAETMEMVTWGAVKSGTNKFYANGTARASVNTPISLNKQRSVIRALKAARARPVTRVLDGSPDTATSPIEAGHIALAHTDLEADIRNLAGFVPVAKYGNRGPASDYEIGSVENTRYVLSPLLTAYADAGGAAGSMVSTTGTSADVYPVIFVSRDSYGLVPLRGMRAITPTVINPGRIDKSDPLGQRGYVGWKAYFAAVVLNHAWMGVLEVAATDL